MGQAKQRQAEIQELKARNPRVRQQRTQRTLVGFGAYYRDDQDDGISIQFSTFQDPAPGLTAHIYKAVKMATDEGLREYHRGKITIPEIWEQLQAAITAFNFKCFGSNQRPQRSAYKIDVIGCMSEIVVIMNDIWMLQLLGEITDDKFNGMTFAYMD